MTGLLTRGVMWDIKTAHYLKKRPDSPFARFLAGWARLTWGDPDGAAKYFMSAADADGDYAPAYIGAVCCDIYSGRFNKAATSLLRYYGKLGLDGRLGAHRFGAAVSICAIRRIKGVDNSSIDIKGGFSRFRNFFADRFRRKLKVEDPSDAGKALLRYLNLIRYIELVSREVGRSGGVRKGDGGRSGGVRKSGSPDEKRALAGGICSLPGLVDEFRLFALADAAETAAAKDNVNAKAKDNASAKAKDNASVAADMIAIKRYNVEFVFDSPAIFTKPLLGKLFREKINEGELRAPRIILSNLRRDSAGRLLDNANKWLFLALCRRLRRDGDIEAVTARELESEGWWADPVVRSYLRD